MNRLEARRLLTLMVVMALAAGFVTLPAQAQEKKVLKVSIIPIADVAPLFAAVKQGYFKAQGLEIDTAPTAGGAVGIPGLLAGAYDIVFTNVVSTVQARSQGLPIRIIAPASAVGDGSQGEGGAAIVARKGEGIKTGADLVGKSLAVNTQKNIIWLYARAWIEKAGGDPSKVTYREVPFPQMLDALRSKSVDAVFAVDPFYTIALGDPALASIGSPYLSVQPGLAVAQYVVSEEFIAKNPETLKRFNTALQSGIEWVSKNLNSKEAHELLSSYTKINPGLLAKMAPMVDPPRRVDAGSIQKTIALMKVHNLLTSEVSVDALLAPSAR
jgi:NitT/TauT family transport system substrate-binding protein